MPRLNGLNIAGRNWSDDMIGIMADDWTGAEAALEDILKKGDFIDPDARNGGLLCVLLLDRFEIYGPFIEILYNDICGRSVVKVITLLRAAQMNLEEFTPEAVKQSILFVSRGIKIQLDFDTLLKAVRERLPNLRTYHYS